MTSEIRALGVGEMLDGAFTLYRRNFAVIYLTALIPQIPLVVAWLLAPVLLGGSAAIEETMPLLMSPYSLFAYFLVIGAVTHAAARVYSGDDVTVGESLGRGLRRWLPMTGAMIVAWLLIVLGLFLLIVPGLIALAMTFGIAAVVMEEERGPLAAIGRSRALSKGARMRILGVLLIGWFITMLPSLAVGLIAGVSVGAGAVFTGEAMVDTTWTSAIVQAAAVLVGSLTMPFLAIVSLLMYYDRLARTEAPELEEAAARLQQRA